MEVLFDSVQEPLHGILRCWWNFGAFSLHDWHQLSDNLTLLISGEEIGDETSSQHIVDILKKSFFFDILISEEESGAFALNATTSEQDL